MAKLLASIVALLGFGSAQQAPPSQIQVIDPSTLYFSMSTISDALPELEDVDEAIGSSDVVFHEDEWRQIEFYPKSRLGELQAEVTKLNEFETQHRKGDVFEKIYVRKIRDATVLSKGEPLTGMFGNPDGSAPILFSGSNSVTGRVKNGFTIPLGPNVYLYGVNSAGTILVLGANVDAGGDHQLLTRAFIRLSEKLGLIAVDWRSHLILVGVAADGNIEVWRPS